MAACFMLTLPDVTLICIETLEHELARLALQESLNKAEFFEVVIFTDRPAKFKELSVKPRFVIVPNWPDKIGWSRYHWQGISPHMRTSFVLCQQWDSWIVDPNMWSNEFLNYDVAGAPWWYKDGKNVGNLGFGLRSTRLLRFMRDHQSEFPITTNVDDDLVCRKYRGALEERGFSWAPERLAHQFAFECVETNERHFGFHAMFNWPRVLAPGPLYERVHVAASSPYIGRSNMMKWFHERNPGLAEHILGDYHG